MKCEERLWHLLYLGLLVKMQLGGRTTGTYFGVLAQKVSSVSFLPAFSSINSVCCTLRAPALYSRDRALLGYCLLHAFVSQVEIQL